MLIIDADLGMANIDVALGIRPQYTLHDVLFYGKSLKETLVVGPEGIRFFLEVLESWRWQLWMSENRSMAEGSLPRGCGHHPYRYRSRNFKESFVLYHLFPRAYYYYNT